MSIAPLKVAIGNNTQNMFNEKLKTINANIQRKLKSDVSK